MEHQKTGFRNGFSVHSPERMTVNHDVTGSSPVGGAKLRRLICGVFSFSEKIIIFILKMIYKYENIGWKRAEFLRTQLFLFLQ